MSISKEEAQKKWYKYLSRALKTRNPNMRKFFNDKATEYMAIVLPNAQTKKDNKVLDNVPKDRYGALRDKMMDE